ncbi:alpha/beta hydrolase [Lonepinella sp. BR2882]|uniref:alpha/beta hydrolase n=1 Tax=Lonepinella sp. BR2882 TaxID=3095283 RepID=UPI003F6E3153
MAVMEVHYYSYSLKSNITLNVIIPTITSNEAITDSAVQNKYSYADGLPVLYLLHGAYGDAFSWLRFSNIDRYAQEKGIAVVMASAENSFYQNLQSGKQYETFFAEELPQFIQSVFPVSKAKDKTYIGGFSMGGYGAWFLALSYPETFAKSVSLSGALDLPDLVSNPKPDYPFNFADAFGDVQTIQGSRYDLLPLYQQAKQKGVVPQLYQAIGTEDFLYQSTQKFNQDFDALGAVYHYEEAAGGHDWEFWDTQIKKALNWLFT